MATNRSFPEGRLQVQARPLVFERMCQLAALLVGARCAYAGRILPVGADGLAYLDLARAYAGHDWHLAVNGYWGPLYAWLLGLGMQLFHPGIHSELALARALNLALYATALYTFGKYWRAVAEWSARTSVENIPVPSASPLGWIWLGYLLFVVNFLWSVDTVNPDILVAAVVFAVAALLFRCNDLSVRRQHSIGTFAGLGLLLAAGYYAKAILFYFAIFILGTMVIRSFRSRSVREPATTILVFIVLVSPFVVVMTRTLGRFSAGDSGRLNYAWFVNGPETRTWEKNSPDAAPLPFYPGPVVFDSPRVFRVPVIEQVTYAPWYDASRFDRRSHPALSLPAQLRQLSENLRYSREQLLGAGAALTVPLLILVWYEPKLWLRRFAATWFCTLPAAAVFGMYLLVHLVQRFVLGFSLLLWGAAWASVCLPPGFQLLARRALLAGSMVFAAYTLPGLLHYLVSQPTESVARDLAIAEALPAYGILPGDRVASLGNGQEAYWAHFARLSVVAEVWSIDTPQFWATPPARQQAALQSMADAGAKAAVWRADSSRPCPPPWRALPQASGCMISLE